MEFVNPREAWLTVILIAGIGFVNYVLLRVYSTRGLYYTAIFGGLVNSTAAVAELASSVTEGAPGAERITITVSLLTVIAMFLRNLVLVSIFSPPAGFIALWPIGAMCLCTVVFAFRDRPGTELVPPSRLSSPVSLRKILSFGVFFLAIQALGALGQRLLGEAGSIVVSFLGGFVSSASTTAAAGSLTVHHQISPRTAAISTVLASIASALVNLPIIYRNTHRTGIFRRLIVPSAVTTVIGLAVLAAFLFVAKK